MEKTQQTIETPSNPSSPVPPTGGHLTYRVEVRTRQASDRPTGKSHIDAAHQLGITGLTHCEEVQLYFLHGNLSPTDTAMKAP